MPSHRRANRGFANRGATDVGVREPPMHEPVQRCLLECEVAAGDVAAGVHARALGVGRQHPRGQPAGRGLDPYLVGRDVRICRGVGGVQQAPCLGVLARVVEHHVERSTPAAPASDGRRPATHAGAPDSRRGSPQAALHTARVWSRNGRRARSG